MINLEIMDLTVAIPILALVCSCVVIFFKRNRKSSQQIMEFRLNKFNDLGMEIAFGFIRNIYEEILYKDPLWHYFYEGPYSLIRCSKKYAKKVKIFLEKESIEFKEPVVWEEGLYVTSKYQHIFKHIFHYTSVLAIELYIKKDHTQYFTAADRIIHAFLNQSLYPAKAAGLCDCFEGAGVDFQYWEVDQMSRLATGRAYYIGRIIGQSQRRK